MTGLDAAQKLMAERGSVVIGIPANESGQIRPGMKTGNFASCPLPDHLRLTVTGTADRQDWEAQVQFLGLSDWNPAQQGERFYFTKLEAVSK